MYSTGSVVLYIRVRCTVQCCTVACGVVLYGRVKCTVQCCTVQGSVMLYSRVQCTVQCCTVQGSVVLYSTARCRYCSLKCHLEDWGSHRTFCLQVKICSRSIRADVNMTMYN